MAITTNNPVTVTTASNTYDTWWIVGHSILSDTPNVRSPMNTQFRLCRRDPDGTVHFYKDDDGNYSDRMLSLGDLFAADPDDAAVAVALGPVFQSVFGQAPPANLDKNMAIQFVVGTLGAIAKVKAVIS